MEKELLETLLAAQVLTLAKTIEISRGANDASVYFSGLYLSEAISQIGQHRETILQQLLNTQ